MSGLNMAPYPHSEVSAYSRVASKIDSHKDAIKRLTPLLAWEEGVKNSTTTIIIDTKLEAGYRAAAPNNRAVTFRYCDKEHHETNYYPAPQQTKTLHT